MTYDELDRLASATSAMFGGTINYTYDVLDNIQTLVAPGGRNLRYCYNTTWQLTFIRSGTTAPPTCSTGAATTTLDYDVQGNLWHKNATEHKFDYGNRLRTVTGKETYRYDAHGRRVLGWSAQGLGNILSMYDRGGMLRYVQDGRRSKRFEYFYLGGSLVASRETPMAGGTSVVKYQHTDALGSPVVVTDASRAVIETSEYEPYGQLLNRPVENGPGYTGHVTDAATGLVYMQQRYYDPVIGRFLSVDPVTALDSDDMRHFNRYAYAYNSPYAFNDPDGRIPMLVGAAAGAGFELFVQGVELAVGGRDRLEFGPVIVSGVAGATGVGAAQFISRGARLGTIAKAALSRASDAGVSAGTQLAKNGKMSLTATALDVAAGATLGRVAGDAAARRAANSATGKVLAGQADRTARIAAQNPRAAKQAAASSAHAAHAEHVAGAAAASGASAANAGSAAANVGCLVGKGKSC